LISVDVEASGPIPGEYSLLSLGACVVGDTKRNFYCEFVPLNENFLPEAMATCDLSLAELRWRGTPPAEAMEQFAQWIKQTANGAWPVFVGFNAPFDWSFVNYYFIKFRGPGGNPFGHTALDIKSYYMGATGGSWKDTAMRNITPDQPLAHNALQDAIQQAEIMERLLQYSDGLSHPADE
jgi:DNA polymerase III epsilon subunit-like protein